MKNIEKDVKCPNCAGPMTFQGVKSVGAGAARISNVHVYLCSKCGCKGRYDEKAQKVIEIQN
jgi:DNA-directed RNA polymerase subunit RPC12/RpoP